MGQRAGHGRSFKADRSFCFFFQKEALTFYLGAAAPPTPRKACSFLKKRTKNVHSDAVPVTG
jgi:hypothetical protein